MVSIRAVLLVAALGVPALSGAQTISLTVNGSQSLPPIVSWDDYAKRTFGDAWDMNQRTDIGWLTWGVDLPASGMVGRQVVNGSFRGTPTNNDPNFFLLDSWFAGASKIGKNGGQFPIDLSRYTMLALKMKMATTVLNQGGTVEVNGAFSAATTFAQVGVPQMNVFWSRDSISYNPAATPNGGSIALGLRCTAELCGPDAVGVEAEVGIAFSPGGTAMAKSMEGGRHVLHTVTLTDFSSTASYFSLKARSDATKWRNFGKGADESWTGAADSLRIDPVNLAGLGEIDVDFVRLLAPDPANSTPLVVSWSGGAYNRYDVVVSTDPSCDDDAATPGAQYTVVAYSQASGFPFLPQTLPAGEYYIGLRDQMCGVVQQCDTGTLGLQSSAVRACSATPVRVVDAPSLTFTSPRPEGSVDDFATTQLGNAWDFTALSDVDLSGGLTGASVGLIPAERPSGVSMGNVQVYTAASTPAQAGNVGDPLVYPFYLTKRGHWSRIDAQRYRLLTLDMAVDRARDLNLGSVPRIVWHIAGEAGINPINGVFGALQNVSADILGRSMAKGATTVDTVSARHVIDRFQADMMDHVMLPLESDTNGSQSRTGWSNVCMLASGSTSPTTGLGGGLVSACSGATPTSDPFGLPRAGIAAFRVDPHEFHDPTTFHIAGIRLAAHERIGGSFTITWTTENPNPAATVHANNANWTVRLYAVPVSPSSPMTPVSRMCAANTSGVIGDFALSSGTATWFSGGFSTAPTSGTITSGALVFVCAGLIPPGGAAPLEFTFSQWPVVYDTTGQTMAPRVFLDKTALRFTAVRSDTTLTAITPAQTVTVSQVGSGSVSWTVDVRDTNGAVVDYVQLAPASGMGAGSFTVSVVPSNQLPHGFTGLSADIGLVIRLLAPGAENSPQYVNMTLALYREGTIATAPAFGQVDTPVHYTGVATNTDPGPCAAASGTPATSDDCVSGSIAVTGWALDDIGVSAVQIYRQCTATEAVASPSPCGPVAGYTPGTALVFVGTASFISGARPDVEAAFPSYPNAHRAGWGFLVLTNMLPNIPANTSAGGQGVFDFYIFAVDAEGHRTLLGRTTADTTPTRIYANNNSAAAPFGAIDFPAQGEVISGVYNNFGWVLTPHSGANAEMDISGAGMAVFVDGVPVGMPTYNLCRGSVAVGGVVPPGQFCNDDISTLFAGGGYRNLLAGRGAIGLLTFDTRTLSNGLHSIAWGVTDSLGRSTGIGSRFITVLNGAASRYGDPTAAFAIATGQEVGLRTEDLRWLGSAPGAVLARRGYDRNAVFGEVTRDRAIVVAEMDRVELALPMPLSEAAWDGYLVRNGRLFPLPPGTSLTPDTGQFAWQSVPGWIGTHDLLFVRQNANGSRERLPVSVTFGVVTVPPASR